MWIEKDPHGEPTGTPSGPVNTYYTGDPYMDELLGRLPLLRPEIAVPATLEGIANYHKLGVTTIYEGHVMDAASIGLFQALRQSDQLKMRVLTSLEAEQLFDAVAEAADRRGFVANLELAREMKSTHDDLLRHNGVTLSRGGPFNPGFIRMNTPYTGPYGELTRGRDFMPKIASGSRSNICAAHDVRLNFIGAGYADHDEFLANAEALAARTPIRDRQWILQHNYLCTADHARRYAELGFVVTTSMSFSCAKGDLFEKRVGAHVWNDLIPLKRLLDAGLTVLAGSDWDRRTFSNTSRWRRRTSSGAADAATTDQRKKCRANERSNVDERRGARARLGRRGSHAPGHHADLLIVDRDTLCCPTEDLASTRVLRTCSPATSFTTQGSCPDRGRSNRSCLRDSPDPALPASRVAPPAVPNLRHASASPRGSRRTTVGSRPDPRTCN